MLSLFLARSRKKQLGLSLLGQIGFIVWSLYALPLVARGEAVNTAEAKTTDVQLVQSVPLETNLAQPDVPLTADVWLEMIRGAKSSIDLAQFYVSQDHAQNKSQDKSPLEPILVEFEKAAKRGVRIRLLVSSMLLQEDPETLERFKKMRGAVVKVLNLSRPAPCSTTSDLLAGALAGSLACPSNGVLHAKYWIVDKKIVFVGSQNLDWRSLSQIQELGVKIQDRDLAKQLGRIFEVDWRLAQNRGESSLGYYLNSSVGPQKIELVASPPHLNPSDTRPAIQALVELLNGAKKTIRIQLLDYAPLNGDQIYWPELDNAIRAAATRKVKVQMVLAQVSSTLRSVDYLKSLSMIPGIEIKLVTLPPFSGGYIPYARLIHSKYMTVDDEVLWLGTSNWSQGYFYRSRNVELILRRLDLAQTANQIFQRIWSSPYAQEIGR